MAGDQLSVDLDGLSSFADELDSVRTRMNATRTLLRAHEGELGSGDLEDALGDFESGWSDGRKRIDANAERLAGMTRTAVDGLRKADSDLAQELSGAGGGQ